MRCPNCDYLNEANANYCSRCGEPMGTVEAEATATFTPIEAEKEEEAHLSELGPGDEVVTSGVFKLRNGAAVQVNNKVQPGNSPAPKPEDS